MNKDVVLSDLEYLTNRLKTIEHLAIYLDQRSIASHRRFVIENCQAMAKAIADIQAEVSTIMTAAEWATEMTRLRTVKPRPLAKLYGTKGPTQEQAAEHATKMREWNRLYRHASKQQKLTLAAENAARAVNTAS